MGEHKYNPTVIKAKNGEIEPKKKPVANPITKADMYEILENKIPMYRTIFHSPEIYVWGYC